MLKKIITDKNLRSLIIKVRGDQSGASILIFSLLLPLIIGMVGLGIETSMWFSTVRQLQSAAAIADLPTPETVKTIDPRV